MVHFYSGITLHLIRIFLGSYYQKTKQKGLIHSLTAFFQVDGRNTAHRFKCVTPSYSRSPTSEKRKKIVLW